MIHRVSGRAGWRSIECHIESFLHSCLCHTNHHKNLYTGNHEERGPRRYPSCYSPALCGRSLRSLYALCPAHLWACY